jgi:predicted permease
MKLAEAWHLSRIPYKEVVYRSIAEERGRMWWGAFGRNQADKQEQNDLELTERALRIAKFDKMFVSVFNIVVALAPFASLFIGGAVFGLPGAVSLSMIATFGFTALYAIQTLSSFVGKDSSMLLSTMPINQGDFSLITLFSFIRSVDYMVIGAILSQVAAVTILTVSVSAALLMLGASAMNALFAVTVALWFSRVFQKNLLRGGRSKVNTVLRMLFILAWGILLVGVGFLLSVPFYVVPNVEYILLGFSGMSNWLSVLYPFSTGVVIASVTSYNVSFTAESISSVVLVLYALLAVVAGRWDLHTVKGIAQGAGVKIGRIAAKDFKVSVHSPLLGYVLKDLKASSRNPATAFFFALPALETVIVALLFSNYATLRTAAVIMATAMGGTFAMFSPLALLTSEGRGLEYTKTLPITSRKIVTAKTLISAATYSLVPLALVVLSLIKPLNSAYAILLPFIAIGSVASASVFEIELFLRAVSQGIATIINDVEKLFVGAITVFLPVVVYSLIFIFSLNNILSLMTMGGAVLAELALATYVLRHLL